MHFGKIFYSFVIVRNVNILVVFSHPKDPGGTSSCSLKCRITLFHICFVILRYLHNIFQVNPNCLLSLKSSLGCELKLIVISQSLKIFRFLTKMMVVTMSLYSHISHLILTVYIVATIISWNDIDFFLDFENS